MKMCGLMEKVFFFLDNHIRNWKTSVQCADKHDFKEEEIQKLNMFYWWQVWPWAYSSSRQIQAWLWAQGETIVPWMSLVSFQEEIQVTRMTVWVSVAETGNLNTKRKCASPVGTMTKENSTGDVGNRSDHGQILEEDRNLLFFVLRNKNKYDNKILLINVAVQPQSHVATIKYLAYPCVPTIHLSCVQKKLSFWVVFLCVVPVTVCSTLSHVFKPPNPIQFNSNFFFPMLPTSTPSIHTQSVRVWL